MLELVEVSLDEIALPIDPCAEGKGVRSVLLGRDIGPCASLCGEVSYGVAVVSAVSKQDRIGLERFQHGGGRLAVMRLSCRQDEIDRPAFGIDKRMDFRGEPATGTSHATIVGPPFFAVAACW